MHFGQIQIEICLFQGILQSLKTTPPIVQYTPKLNEILFIRLGNIACTKNTSFHHYNFKHENSTIYK